MNTILKLHGEPNILSANSVLVAVHLFNLYFLCIKAKLVQATYVNSIIQSLPQRSGVIDVSLVFACIR